MAGHTLCLFFRVILSEGAPLLRTRVEEPYPRPTPPHMPESAPAKLFNGVILSEGAPLLRTRVEEPLPQTDASPFAGFRASPVK